MEKPPNRDQDDSEVSRAKIEKTQPELRKKLESRFLSLKPVIEQGMKEYAEALKDGIFEDKEDEEVGVGGVRKGAIQDKLNAMVERAEKMKVSLESKKELPQYTEEISVMYKAESISLDLEQKVAEFTAFYQKTGIDLPSDFEDSIREIWERNIYGIQKAIEENGFDDILLIPETKNLSDLHNKMTEGYNVTLQGDNFKEGGSFASAKSQNVDKSRIVLVNKTQNLKDSPELAKTLNIKGQDAIKKEILILEDYLIFQRKYFEETEKHLDENGRTWLDTKSGARLVNASWNPGGGRVGVFIDGLDAQSDLLGARPSRSFF